MTRCSTYLLLIGLMVCATGFKTSSSCANRCTTEASIRCDGPCNLNISVLPLLRLSYGRDVVDTCTKSCRCDKDEYVYSADKVCEIIRSFAVMGSSQDCQCKQGMRVGTGNSTRRRIQSPEPFARRDANNYFIYKKVARALLRTRSEDTTINPWENWCKHKCAEGLGGSACYCDILP